MASNSAAEHTNSRGGGIAIDPKSGFCSKTKIFHSLRPKAPLPPPTAPLSATHYLLSNLRHHPSATALLDASTGRQILYPEFTRRVQTLAAALRSRLGLSRGDCAFILSPNSVHLPVVYLALLSVGAAVSPSNPVSSAADISYQIRLSNPAVAFATAATAHKIPNSSSNSLRFGTVLLDSADFESMMTCPSPSTAGAEERRVEEVVEQSDTATILYSSGTTGRVKGVELTHRNWITMLAGSHAVGNAAADSSPAVALCTVPFFHVYGFAYCLRVLAIGDTLAWMPGRFDLKGMMRAIGRFRVSQVALAPPVAVAVAKLGVEMDGYDLSSLQVIGCGGAPLAKSVIQKLKQRLPNVQVAQGYGLTETTARVFAAVGQEETRVEGANGKLMSNFEAKVADPETGIGLPPMMSGELWVRGPCIMKGEVSCYIGDEEANATVIDSEGWFKTGDLCYVDNEGFLFFVERIKELIKYKGYQVAPAELEHLLQSHPDITDAAVIPYPDEEAGQIPMAFVVRRLGSAIDESRIKDFIAEQVAPYKKIRRVTFINTIPKNAQGKVLRKELAKVALSRL